MERRWTGATHILPKRKAMAKRRWAEGKLQPSGVRGSNCFWKNTRRLFFPFRRNREERMDRNSSSRGKSNDPTDDDFPGNDQKRERDIERKTQEVGKGIFDSISFPFRLSWQDLFWQCEDFQSRPGRWNVMNDQLQRRERERTSKGKFTSTIAL